MTNILESWYGQRERDSDPQSCRLASKVHPDKCILRMVDTKKNILTGHKAKLLGHRTRKKGKSYLVFFWLNIGSLGNTQTPKRCATGRCWPLYIFQCTSLHRSFLEVDLKWWPKVSLTCAVTTLSQEPSWGGERSHSFSVFHLKLWFP